MYALLNRGEIMKKITKFKTLLIAMIAGLSIGMSVNAIPNYPVYTATIVWMGHGIYHVTGYGYNDCTWAANHFVNTHKVSHILAPGCTAPINS